MKAFKRAFLYITRKRSKSMLLALIVFIISTLAMFGLAAMDAEEEKSDELRGTTGSNFAVEKIEKWEDAGGTEGGVSRINVAKNVTKEMIEKIAAVDGIKAYNATGNTVAYFADKKEQPLIHENSIGAPTDSAFQAFGSINTEYAKLFLARKLALIEGRHITKDDKNTALISDVIAKKHGLKVGDKISAVIDPENDDPTVEFTIVGIFQVLADEEDEKDPFGMDALYGGLASYMFVSINGMKDMVVNYSEDPENEYQSAEFYVSDPQQLEQIIKEVKKIKDIDWDEFNIVANDKVYERAGGSMSDISKLIRILLAVIIAISMCIVTLILSMWMKSRVRETGILLALGVSKASILLQHILEVSLIALCSFPLAYVFSRLAASGLGSLLGKAGSIAVTTQHFGLTCGFGALLLIVAILISCIPVMRLAPKEILSKMD